MKTFVVAFIVGLLLASCEGGAKHESINVTSVNQKIKALPEGSRVRVSELLISAGLLKKWTVEREKDLLVDSEGSFGHYSRTFSLVVNGERPLLVTVLGKGEPKEVAGGDYLIEEIRVGYESEAESIFHWSDGHYIYQGERNW